MQLACGDAQRLVRNLVRHLRIVSGFPSHFLVPCLCVDRLLSDGGLLIGTLRFLSILDGAGLNFSTNALVLGVKTCGSICSSCACVATEVTIPEGD